MKQLILLLLLAAGFALAHSELEDAIPAPNSTVKALPAVVEVSFTEAVEIKLSTFKIYALEGTFATPKAAQDAAIALVKNAIGSKNDQTKRLDAGLATTAETASKIRIKLNTGIKAGTYVVMWKVLSVDGHVSSDYFLFTYKP